MPNEIYAAILGALAGAWVTYRFALRLAQRQFENIAAAKLRAAFAPVLVSIRQARRGKRDGVGEFIENSIPQLAIAVEEFRAFIAECDIPAYEKCWHECESAASLNDFVPKADPYREVERVFQNLLHFAKQT